MLRLKHQQVTFTACGLFPIDNTLLYAVSIKQKCVEIVNLFLHF